MPKLPLIVIYCLLIACATSAKGKHAQHTNDRHLFFLHNRFIEDHDLLAEHPRYGNAHYAEILKAFRDRGFVVHSEKRPPRTDVRAYARGIAVQVDSLLDAGVPPEKVSVVGTSKGGYIAQYVSTYLANPAVNFVLVGCYRETDLEQLDDIDFCGNIFTIYEASDEFGISALDRKLTSGLPVTRFREIELHTGLGHGFLFRPMEEWIEPAALWAAGRYDEVGTSAAPYPVTLDTLSLLDRVRGREIPVAVYRPVITMDSREVIIFNHGYGANSGDSYLRYSYLTAFLASRGYFVISIQHELKTDSLIPSAGIPQIVRRPFWERGTDNIRFVIDELKRKYPRLDWKRITLIGHSNGGDMVALFPQRYPGLVENMITLDNRRMPLPRTNYPCILSLRSSDQPADEGVLPSEAEQRRWSMQIVRLESTTHNEMDDSADAAQRREIRDQILSFLTDHSQ